MSSMWIFIGSVLFMFMVHFLFRYLRSHDYGTRLDAMHRSFVRFQDSATRTLSQILPRSRNK